MAARTMFDKLWHRHVIAEEDGESLLYIDRALIHEGSSHAFDAINEQRRSVFRPKQVFAFNDHYVPTSGRDKGACRHRAAGHPQHGAAARSQRGTPRHYTVRHRP